LKAANVGKFINVTIEKLVQNLNPETEKTKKEREARGL